MNFLAGRWRKIILVAALLFASWPIAVAQERRRDFYAPAPAESIHAVPAEFGMVVAQEKLGAQIGGGGFMVIHSAERNEDVAIDYRETAPAATRSDIFLGGDGKPDTDKSRNSALGIGVPGTVAGLALALEKYGSGH